MSITSRLFVLALTVGLAAALSAAPTSAADAKKRTAAKPAATGVADQKGEKANAEATEAVPSVQTDKPVDLNFALKNELMTLPGVDEEMAAKIIAGRPYIHKTQLRMKKILSAAEFYAILDRITIDVDRLDRQEKAERERKLREKQRNEPTKDTGPKKKTHQGPVTLGPGPSN